MKKNIELPPALSEMEKIEYLKFAAEYWRNYCLVLEEILERENEAEKVV